MSGAEETRLLPVPEPPTEPAACDDHYQGAEKLYIFKPSFLDPDISCRHVIDCAKRKLPSNAGFRVDRIRRQRVMPVAPFDFDVMSYKNRCLTELEGFGRNRKPFSERLVDQTTERLRNERFGLIVKIFKLKGTTEITTSTNLEPNYSTTTLNLVRAFQSTRN
ncbi:uncharacterized protein LOC129754791 [Uranotaenia lowii]|uniref:uncharacterized protein LOC129754791 n=1 Tax=Uranotaenia lowii TaxID=190385 RepID=UPI0024784F1E|nr:uncharacterized protein LOC129754791 [Uranotaenia lowii]